MDSPFSKPIKSFKDLVVYQNTYKACVIVHQNILPRLPQSEHFDLHDQLSRSTKAVPRLIAEGYAKKHQKAGFQKYIDDAMAECNESIVGLEQTKDIYKIEVQLCTELIDTYDKSARQLYKLAEAWDNFKQTRRKTTPNNDTGIDTVKRLTITPLVFLAQNTTQAIDFDKLKDAVSMNPLFKWETGETTAASQIYPIFSEILKYLYVIGGLLLLFYLIAGGFQMMTAAHDEKGLVEAKGKITNALVGFLLLFVSYWVVQIMEYILGIQIF